MQRMYHMYAVYAVYEMHISVHVYAVYEVYVSVHVHVCAVYAVHVHEDRTATRFACSRLTSLRQWTHQLREQQISRRGGAVSRR